MTRQLDNWLEHYLKFNEPINEAPVLYSLWCGIMAISSCLQRKCYMEFGYEMNIYPNFYTVLVGPPGGRKGTSMKIAKAMVRAVDVILSSDSLGSIQALYKEINEAVDHIQDPDTPNASHRSLSVWSEEFQVFLSDSDPRFIGNLTDLFDCPKQWKYSALTSGVKNLSNCWLTIFGATTASLLQSKLSNDAVGGGLISRIIFVVGYGKEKRIPISFLSEEDIELKDLLIEDLQQIKNMAGKFYPTQGYVNKYVDWYMSPNADRGVDSDKFLGYNERRALHLRKLSLIMSASENNDMIVKEHHFDRALHILEMTEQEMPNAFYGLGQGNHAQLLAKVSTYLKDIKEVTWVQLLQKFQLEAMPDELERILDMLAQTQRIRIGLTGQNKRIFTYNEERKDSNKDYYNHELFKYLKRN